jgi:hypothetical protein
MKKVTKQEHYGTYVLNSTKGSLENESEHAELLQHLLNNEDVEFCSVSKLIDGQIITEVIIDKTSW